MSRKIHRFVVDGRAQDEMYIFNNRVHFERELENGMRLKGYVRVLDLDSVLEVAYHPDLEFFTYKVTVYGSYVGKQKAVQAVGMQGDDIIYDRKK